MVGTLFSMMIYGKQKFSKAFGWYLLTLVGNAVLFFAGGFLAIVLTPWMAMLIDYFVGYLFVKSFLKQDPTKIGGKDGASYFSIYLLGLAFNFIIALLVLFIFGFSVITLLGGA